MLKTLLILALAAAAFLAYRFFKARESGLDVSQSLRSAIGQGVGGVDPKGAEVLDTYVAQK